MQVLVQHQHVHVVLCAGARPYLISLTSNGAEDSSMRRYDPDKYWENMHFCFVLHFQNKRLDKIKQARKLQDAQAEKLTSLQANKLTT